MTLDSLPDNLHTEQQAFESWKLVCRLAATRKFTKPDDVMIQLFLEFVDQARTIYHLEDRA